MTVGARGGRIPPTRAGAPSQRRLYCAGPPPLSSGHRAGGAGAEDKDGGRRGWTAVPTKALFRIFGSDGALALGKQGLGSFSAPPIPRPHGAYILLRPDRSVSKWCLALAMAEPVHPVFIVTQQPPVLGEP